MYSVITTACFTYFIKLNVLYNELVGKGMKSLFVLPFIYLWPVHI